MGEDALAVDEVDYNNPPFPLPAIDRELLAMKDEDFHEITWQDLKDILARNTLEDLKRRPSDLRRYLAWSHKIKQAYGGITPFVIAERLFWQPLPPSSHQSSSFPSEPTSSEPESKTSKPSQPPQFKYTSPVPFAEPSDFAVLKNDWPYGFAPRITHLLVWSKTPIAVDLSGGGDVTAESRARIEAFVREFFVRDLESLDSSSPGREEARERVLWFKNWVALQSVRGVDHVHVLVRDAPEELLRKWVTSRDLEE